MPAFRTRFILAVLVFVLVAAACGGCGDSAPADRVEDARPDTADPSEDARPEASVTSEAEPQEDALAATSTSPRSEPEEAAVEQPVPEPVQARLGDRFAWCADVQAMWDAHDESQAARQAAETILRDAEDAYGSATDELDKAETLTEVERARSVFWEAVEAADESRSRAANDLADAYDLHRDGSADPLGVANSRAWLAFVESAASQTLAAINDYEDAVVALEVVGSEADAELQRAEAAYDESLWDAEIARDAVIEITGEGLSGSLPIELEAVFNAEHYASVEALGPPPPEPGNENANEATEAWQASPRRLQDAIDGIEGGYEEAMWYLVPMLPAPEEVTSTAEDWGVPEAWLESLIEWNESLIRLVDARAIAVSAAYEKYAEARMSEIDELMDRLFVEAFAAREADYQAAIAAADSALSDARVFHRETKSLLRDAVADARSAFDAALASSVSGSTSYQSFKISFQESCE